MWLKFLLGGFFVLSLLTAFVVAPLSQKTHNGSNGENGNSRQSVERLRLMSWNIGNADLETESRAHTEDLPSVARVILDHEPDAVALQELSGKEQLQLLLRQLENRYRGYACGSGNGDRVEAVLVKQLTGTNDERGMRFNDVPAGDRFAAAATFRLRQDLPEVVLLSVHADAFNASRRRTFTEAVVDWGRGRAEKDIVFIAGDFNFEVNTRNRTNLFTDNAKHDSESFAYLLKYFRDLARDAGETSINDRRIDYVFGPSSIPRGRRATGPRPATVSIRRAEVLRHAAVGHMDHWPLLVEVAF